MGDQPPTQWALRSLRVVVVVPAFAQRFSVMLRTPLYYSGVRNITLKRCANARTTTTTLRLLRAHCVEHIIMFFSTIIMHRLYFSAITFARIAYIASHANCSKYRTSGLLIRL